MLRYENAYAAMIASGTWKPKKHKDMAAEARRAWAGLKRSHPRTLWLGTCEVAAATAADIAVTLAERGHAGDSVNDPPAADPMLVD